MDSNNDGYVTKSEFNAGLTMLGVTPPVPYMITYPWQQVVFDEMDKNKDGRIDEGEFNKATTEALQKWFSML